MFGYIAPVLSTLTEEQKSRYHAFYCGVCHALKLRHGHSSRLSLSHDMTFLAMLLSSLYEPETVSASARCLVHPVKEHLFFSSEMIDYAADMNMLLFHYKCLDAEMDDHSAAGKLGAGLSRSSLQDISRRYPDACGTVREALQQLWSEEKKPDPDPDRLCHLSGRMLGAVFVPRPDDLWAPVLHRTGYGLGRFVYWMDAWDDLESDTKKRRFNPLTPFRDREDYASFCHDTLEMLMADAAEAFEMLPLEQDLPVLRNTIYSGVWQKYILKEKKQHREGKDEKKDAQ